MKLCEHDEDTQIATLYQVLWELVNKIEEMEQCSEYQGVWSLYRFEGYGGDACGYDGLTCIDELRTAKTVLEGYK